MFNESDLNIIELHGISDATPRACGTCVYIKVIDKSGDITVKFLTAKSRVRLLKQIFTAHAVAR